MQKLQIYNYHISGQSGDRMRVGVRFSTPVEMDPGAHLASYTKCIRFLPQVKRPGHGIDHSPNLALILKKDWSYTITPCLGLVLG